MLRLQYKLKWNAYPICNILANYLIVCIPLTKGFLFSSTMVQSDDECCNSCEEVRDAYRRKGWAMTNADLIDQVCLQVLSLSIVLLLFGIYVLHMLRIYGIFLFWKIFILLLPTTGKQIELSVLIFLGFYSLFFLVCCPVQKRRLFRKDKRAGGWRMQYSRISWS